MKRKTYENSSIILKTGDVCQSIMFVENGEVLIDTKCEGNKFVLERLG